MGSLTSTSSGMDFDYLLERYGVSARIRREDVGKMGVRYKHQPINNLLGSWISRGEARRRLELECEKQQSKEAQGSERLIGLRRDQIAPLAEPDIDAFYHRAEDGSFIPK